MKLKTLTAHRHSIERTPQLKQNKHTHHIQSSDLSHV